MYPLPAQPGSGQAASFGGDTDVPATPLLAESAVPECQSALDAGMAAGLDRAAFRPGDPVPGVDVAGSLPAKPDGWHMSDLPAAGPFERP